MRKKEKTVSIVMWIALQCEAPKIAKLVNITPITIGLWRFMVFITIVTGANLNQLSYLGGLTL